jgi:hypothetical protein
MTEEINERMEETSNYEEVRLGKKRIKAALILKVCHIYKTNVFIISKMSLKTYFE